MSRKPLPPYLRLVQASTDRLPQGDGEAYPEPPDTLEELRAADPELAASVEASLEAARKDRADAAQQSLELYYAMYCDED